MEELRDILAESLFVGKREREKLRRYSIVAKWEEIVGQPIARNSLPYKIKEGVVFIKVSSPIWAQELSMISEELIAKINEFIGTQEIKALRFITDSSVSRRRLGPDDL